MKRERLVPADPARATAATCTAIEDLIVAALPRAVGVREALARVRHFIAYLVATEELAEKPLVLLVGDSLECEVYTVHGMGALATDEPAAPPGGAHATDWTLCVPVPEGAPYTAADIAAAGSHFVTERSAKTKVAPAGLRTGGVAALVDPDELRKAVR